MLKKYFLLFIFCFAIYIVHSIATRQGIYGDGNGYYSYTNSLYFQKNLDFKPIYDYLGNFQGNKYIFSRVFWNMNANSYLIGPGLIWIPSMFFISAVNSVFGLNAGRFDLIYELGPGITGIILMLSGLYFLERYLLNFFPKRTVFWAVITTFFASNVLYYSSFEPALSHEPAFFLICFLLYWTYKLKIGKLNLFILGLLSGLLAITRIADVVLLIPIYFHIKPKIKDFLYIIPGGLIAVFPQLIVHYVVYHNIFIHPYLTGEVGVFRFNLVHTFEYLFSPMRGLFLWSPIFLVCFWGLIKSKSKMFLFAISILWLITSSWSAYLSAGFGQRYSFTAIPFFVFGLTYLFKKMSTKWIVVIFTIFSIWNGVLLANFYLHKDRLIQAAHLTFNEFIFLQVKTPLQVLQYFK